MLRESLSIAEDAGPSALDAGVLQPAVVRHVAEPPPLSAGSASAATGTNHSIGRLETAAALSQPVLLLPAEEPSAFGDWLLRAPSWLISMVVHLLLMLLLAIWSAQPDRQHGELGVIATQFHTGPVDVNQLEPPQVDILNSRLDEATKASDTLIKGDVSKLLVPAGELLGPPTDVVAIGTGPLPAMPGGAFGADSLLAGNSLETRLDGDMRTRLLLEGGGTLESEAAVDRALLWLSRHQNSDGSWNYNLKKCAKCNGKCQNSGSVDARVAATAMALLPFLGKGQTHKTGQYRNTIHSGLYFLMRSIRRDRNVPGSLNYPGGRMYGHGLAAIALCEAYGMTRDKMLKGPAQATINYIVAAQDPRGGGWRYDFQQAGDTSVVGWQLMALKSAQMAYLDVPTETIRQTEYFLDSVQSDGGAAYGYTNSGAGQATSAIGLLCRLYIGGRNKQEAIARGGRQLASWGPATEDGGTRVNDMYYNYYATQVLHHIGGEQWNAWNQPMRSHLIKTQSLDEERHDYGSWSFTGNDHGLSQGGRLYCTAMSAMILEVYYRHMPLYRQKPGKGFFN